MDTAVALVGAYLRFNGYISIPEQPILVGQGRPWRYHTATDLDILAVRFPWAAVVVPRVEGEGKDTGTGKGKGKEGMRDGVEGGGGVWGGGLRGEVVRSEVGEGEVVEGEVVQGGMAWVGDGVGGAGGVGAGGVRGAGGMGVSGRGAWDLEIAVDPMLDLLPGTVDVLVAEVKEGRPRLNEALRDPTVLQAALRRLDAGFDESLDGIVARLIEAGEAVTESGGRRWRFRLAAFGDGDIRVDEGAYRVFPLRHVALYLIRCMSEHHKVWRDAQFGDTVLDLLHLLDKLGLGLRRIDDEHAKVEGGEGMATATLRVQGMSCGHCVHAVTEALNRVDGVRLAEVDLEAGRATVEYDETRTSPRDLVGAIMDEGYTAEELA